MKIPEFIDWLISQDQSLEVGVVELQTEYKEYSGKEETRLNTFCFTIPEEQSSIQHGVLILGTVGQPKDNQQGLIKHFQGEIDYCQEILSLYEGAMTQYQSNEYSTKIVEYNKIIDWLTKDVK